MHGNTVLIEDVDATMDPSLDDVFNKNVFEDEGGVEKINFGERAVDYDHDFRLYISSSLANPHFLPETCIKLTVVNFTVTREGLEDQMLVDVVNNEAPEVEQKRDALVVSIAESRNKLDGYKSSILNELAASDASTILDNEALISNLEISRTASISITAELQESEEVEKQINITRNAYRDVAVRGSILYFSIVDMSGIDPMY
jgi:dynein heavy chain